MRRTVLALCLSFAAAAAACNDSSQPAEPGPERTIETFEPYLTRDLTPALSNTRFGAPDEITGSGLIIYKYRLDAGRTLWLSFPGFAPIISARLESRDGKFSEVTIR